MNAYRGRRRLPRLPSKRFLGVVSTAVMAAGVVAVGAPAVLPADLSDPRPPMLADRLAAADEQARAGDNGPVITVDADAADVWLLPLRMRFYISSEFAPRFDGMHFGVDLAAPGGTPIHATHAGTVSIAEWYGGYGLCVQIDNGDGIITVFGHASGLNVHRGQQVKAGDVIAWVGNTGASFGDHLHYEVRVNGNQHDPVRFMREHGVDLERRTEAATGGVPVA